jgi:ketosteroid isomerase-like protein
MLRSDVCEGKENRMRRFVWLGRKAALVAAFVLMLLSSAAALAQKPSKKPSKDQKGDKVAFPDDRAIDLAISEMLAAWQLGNVEMLHKYYADDTTIVSGGWEPPLVGWANYLKAYQSQRERLQTPRLDRTNTLIKVRGNLAWAVYQWEFNAVVDGKAYTARGHTSLILEKRGDRWVIVHNHTSIVPETPPAPPADAPKPSGALGPGNG